MKIVITGAGGFLGARLAEALLAADSPLPVTELLLTDTTEPPAPRHSKQGVSVTRRQLDITAPGAGEDLIDATVDVFFHLAAIVSGHAEADLDLGFRVNFDATRALLEAARRRAPSLRFVFASTLGVFGGELPSVVTDLTAPTPQNSYGTAKAMSELLLNDYSRRGLVDGRAVRLPTVTVRAGAANRAVTSFASGVVREPLAGLEAVVPVDAAQELWVTSPRTVVRNIIHAATLPAEALGPWRVVALPGLVVSVREQVAALAAVAGERVAARVRFVRDEAVARMVESFPARFDNTRALSLGFTVDRDFTDIIRAYINDDLGGRVRFE